MLLTEETTIIFFFFIRVNYMRINNKLLTPILCLKTSLKIKKPHLNFNLGKEKVFETSTE